jgi:hypothetical protein
MTYACDGCGRGFAAWQGRCQYCGELITAAAEPDLDLQDPGSLDELLAGRHTRVGEGIGVAQLEAATPAEREEADREITAELPSAAADLRRREARYAVCREVLAWRLARGHADLEEAVALAAVVARVLDGPRCRQGDASALPAAWVAGLLARDLASGQLDQTGSGYRVRYPVARVTHVDGDEILARAGRGSALALGCLAGGSVGGLLHLLGLTEVDSKATYEVQHWLQLEIHPTGHGGCHVTASHVAAGDSTPLPPDEQDRVDELLDRLHARGPLLACLKAAFGAWPPEGTYPNVTRPALEAWLRDLAPDLAPRAWLLLG